MFTKILIANRGEIACRIMKTAHALGIRTVAVYSDADAQALFVSQADEAWRLGPAPAAESYLRGDLILQIAQQSGAQAIHPGYGFLSENADFAQACAQAGIVFIGPPASAMAAMGSKSAAKALMQQANVPLVPGYHGDQQQPDFLQQQADAMGYPVLIKASAGGGGKGMRIVEQASEFAAALASCQREAQASFGEAKVLIEKYLPRARHVEIQVFADNHGQCVYLFDRDCSVQRRHQKVLEEAPAPNLPDSTRLAMGQAACDAARAVGYVGAGTVEFILDVDSGQFYFMEMNTRLQVEHPVTEMISGQDLVAWQLQVAAGEPLPLSQAQLSVQGHAIEARIYAEDPDKGFLPATGQLLHLHTPPIHAHLRIDSGVVQGDSISPFYDPMIAKLIAWGRTRDQARQRLEAALGSYQIVGVANNLTFLRRLLQQAEFVDAQMDTSLIARHQAELLPPPSVPSTEQLALLALAEVLANPQSYPTVAGWRLNSSYHRELIFYQFEQSYSVMISFVEAGFELSINHQILRAQAQLNGRELTVQFSDHTQHATVVPQGELRHLFYAGQTLSLRYPQPLSVELSTATAAEASLTAPMPGRIVTQLVTAGSHVEADQALLILEAMKMEHTLHAPCAGTVQAFCYAVGEQVAEGAQLLEFAADTKP